MDRTKAKEFEKVLKALANQRRLAILYFIKQKKEVTVGAAAQELKISFKATSKHLALLVAAGILDKEQRSTQMFFWVSPNLHEISKRVLSLL